MTRHATPAVPPARRPHPRASMANLAHNEERRARKASGLSPRQWRKSVKLARRIAREAR